LAGEQLVLECGRGVGGGYGQASNQSEQVGFHNGGGLRSWCKLCKLLEEYLGIVCI